MSSEVVFTGSGNMGLPMARNILSGGISMAGIDLGTENVAPSIAIWGSDDPSLADAIQDGKVVIPMLPASQHVKSMYSGENGINFLAKPGTLLINSPTIAPEVSMELGLLTKEHGMVMPDAPVSGGIYGAKTATLTFMVDRSKKGFFPGAALPAKNGQNYL